MSSQRRTNSYRSGSRQTAGASYGRRSARNLRDDYREEYLYGNAAPAYTEEYDPEEERREREEEFRLEQERREAELRAERERLLKLERERERAAARVRVQVVAAVLMLSLLTISIVSYVELMSKVSVSENHISSLETKIENLKTQNDETLEEINSSINLEEIKEIAINDLGMKYADSSQIVTYSSGTDEYVHQVQEAGN